VILQSLAADTGGIQSLRYPLFSEEVEGRETFSEETAMSRKVTKAEERAFRELARVARKLRRAQERAQKAEKGGRDNA